MTAWLSWDEDLREFALDFPIEFPLHAVCGEGPGVRPDRKSADLPRRAA